MQDEGKVILAFESAINKFIETNTQLPEEERVAVVSHLWFDHLRTILDQAYRWGHERHRSFLTWHKFTPAYPFYEPKLENAFQLLDEDILRSLLPLGLTNPIYCENAAVRFAAALLQLGIAMYFSNQRKMNKAMKGEIETIKKSHEEFLKESRGSWSTIERLAKIWFEANLIITLKASILDSYRFWMRSMLCHKNEQLEKEKTDLNATIDTLRKEHSRVNKELKTATQQLKTATQQLKTATRDRDDIQGKLKNIQQLKQDLQNRLNDSERRYGIQKSVIEQSKQEGQNAKIKKDELERDLEKTRSLLDATISESTERIDSLVSAASELRRMHDTATSEKERLRTSLQQALEVKAKIEISTGITECQKDELIPSLNDLETDVRSAHSIFGRPLAQEIEKMRIQDPDQQILELLERCFSYFKHRWQERVSAAGRLLYKENLAECTDIRRLLLSKISGGSEYDRQCRYDLFDAGQLLPIADNRLTHSDRCAELFGRSAIPTIGTSSDAECKWCFCEFVHFCALMAINGFEMQCNIPGNPSENYLKYFDIINEHQYQGSPFVYKMIWPAIRLPSSGEIVCGKIEKVYRPDDIREGWHQLSQPANDNASNKQQIDV